MHMLFSKFAHTHKLWVLSTDNTSNYKELVLLQSIIYVYGGFVLLCLLTDWYDTYINIEYWSNNKILSRCEDISSNFNWWCPTFSDWTQIIFIVLVK